MYINYSVFHHYSLQYLKEILEMKKMYGLWLKSSIQREDYVTWLLDLTLSAEMRIGLLYPLQRDKIHIWHLTTSSGKTPVQELLKV